MCLGFSWHCTASENAGQKNGEHDLFIFLYSWTKAWAQECKKTRSGPSAPPTALARARPGTGPGRVLGVLCGAWEVLQSSRGWSLNCFVMYPVGIVMFLWDFRGHVKTLKVQISNRSIIRGLGPPELLPEAKSDEKERTKPECWASNTPWA